MDTSSEVMPVPDAGKASRRAAWIRRAGWLAAVALAASAVVFAIALTRPGGPIFRGRATVTAIPERADAAGRRVVALIADGVPGLPAGPRTAHVKSFDLLDGIESGDRIRVTLRAQGDALWIARARRIPSEAEQAANPLLRLLASEWTDALTFLPCH